MASFKKIKGGWQAQVAIKGTREAKNFSTKAEATSWATERETAIRKKHETGIDLSKTVGMHLIDMRLRSRLKKRSLPGRRTD